MLAAILPANREAWFFKVVGPIADVDKHEKEINEFFAGLSLADDGRAHWKLPPGWAEEPGNGVREATIVIPSGRRSSDPVPVPRASGKPPSSAAIVVIMIGRKRSRQAW